MDIDRDLVDNIKACRTCGIHYVSPSKHQLKHLFQSCQEHSEILLIRLELSRWSVEVAENDGYPQYVCSTCIHKFEQVFQLRTACINSQNEFRKFYAVTNGNASNVKVKTELPDPDEVPPRCDFIYVDDLSDAEYDGATPFNFPHVPIKEEVIEAAAIPMEEFEQPTNLVESASRMILRTEPASSQIPQPESQDRSGENSLPAAAVMQVAGNEIICNLCQYISYNQQEYKHHMGSAHDIRDLECNVCGKEFKNSTRARLKFHMKFHSLNRQIKCTLCGFVCNSKDSLREHKTAIHRKLNCKICGKGIVVKKMKLHLRQHELSFKYACEYCTKAFATELERENHIWGIHAKEDNAAFSSMENFQTINDNSFKVAHEETLCQEPQEHVLFKFLCAQCDHRFIDQTDLERHVKEEHRTHLATIELPTVTFGENARIDETCEIIKNEGDDNKEAKITVLEEYDSDNHVSESNVVPSIIDSQVLQQDFTLTTSSSDFLTQNKNEQKSVTDIVSNILSHEETDGQVVEHGTNTNLPSYCDSNLNTFACAKCSETFSTIEQLRKHHDIHLAADQQLKSATSKSKFQCHLCAKSFDLKFSLNRHIKKHCKYPPF